MRLIICPRAEGFHLLSTVYCLLSRYRTPLPRTVCLPGLSGYDKWDSAMNYIVYTNYFIGRQHRLLNTQQITHIHSSKLLRA